MTEAPPNKRVLDQLERMDAAFDAVDALLRRLAAQGLQRASSASAAELQAVSTTAHNAGLITIERKLATLATAVERYLKHDPLFSTRGYADLVNEIWLLNRAARRQRAEGALPEDMLDLIGQARRTYTEVDAPLSVQCVAASAWASDSGFIGVTLTLFSPDHHELLEISAARPVMYFGDDPRRLWRMPVHDALEQRCADLAHGAWRLGDAKLSADGRLSLHGGLRVEKAPFRGAEALNRLRTSDFSALVQTLRRASLSPAGGRERALVLVEPVSASPVTLDEKRALALAELKDQRGARLEVRVPLRKENNFLIDNLERLWGPRPDGEDPPPTPDLLVGRVWAEGDRLAFEPLTAVYRAPIRVDRQMGHEVHLSLESLAHVRLAR